MRSGHPVRVGHRAIGRHPTPAATTWPDGNPTGDCRSSWRPVRDGWVENSINAHQFRDLFDNRAIVIDDLPPGTAHDLAAEVNRPAGPGDATLRTEAEFNALFDAIRRAVGPDREAMERLVD